MNERLSCQGASKNVIRKEMSVQEEGEGFLLKIMINILGVIRVCKTAAVPPSCLRF